MRLYAKSDLALLKFTFMEDFFSNYKCSRRQRCYVHARALLGPAKTMVRLIDKRAIGSPPIIVDCSVEDELNNQIIFKIGSGPKSTSLTYRIYINDMEPSVRNVMESINHAVDYWRVRISPKQDLKGHFLMPALAELPSMMDQVTIRCSLSEIRFTGGVSPAKRNFGATTEFVHKRNRFSAYSIREATNITLPLTCLRKFVNFAETNKIPVDPTYTFEGFGLPAHFVYRNPSFKAQFVSATAIDFIPDYAPTTTNNMILELEMPLPPMMLCYDTQFEMQPEQAIEQFKEETFDVDQDQEEAPEQDPEQVPEQDLEQAAEQEPEQALEPVLEQAVEQAAEQVPEQVLEQAMEQAPGQDLVQVPEQASEQGPEQVPEQVPEQAAKQAPEQALEQVPEQDQDQERELSYRESVVLEPGRNLMQMITQPLEPMDYENEVDYDDGLSDPRDKPSMSYNIADVLRESAQMRAKYESQVLNSG